MSAEREAWGLLDVLDAFASGERSPHVWAGAQCLATVIRREAEQPFGKQRLEQTLTSTQREEMAALLRYACYRTLRTSKSLRRALPPARSADGSIWQDDEELWRTRINGASVDGDAAKLLHRAFGAGWTEAGIATDLAVAASRIDDGPTSRLYVAYIRTVEGDVSRALGGIRGMELGWRELSYQRRALTIQAYALSRLGRLHMALEASRTAAHMGAPEPETALGWMSLAVRVGSEHEFRSAGWLVAECGAGRTEMHQQLEAWLSDLDADAREQVRHIWKTVMQWSEGIPSVTQDVLQGIQP
jgi:hypothetical protein